MRKIVCFHNPDEENGYLSNWYMSEFNFNGIKYSSMEQYMMHQKAKLFGDEIMASKILKEHDVAKVKRMGREVKGFDNKIWDANKINIITAGLIEKFSQNSELREKLLGTGDALLAEMAVRDKIWATGVSLKSSNKYKPETWTGQNLLGKCLMSARETIRNER